MVNMCGFENVHKNMRILGLICIIFVLIISVLAFITIAISVRPLLYVEDAIIQLSNLKLEKSKRLTPWINTKSEIGKIATAMNSLYDALIGIIATLSDCSTSLSSSATAMQRSSESFCQGGAWIFFILLTQILSLLLPE